MKMGLSSRFSYRRLQQEGIGLDDEELSRQIGRLRLSSSFRMRRRSVHLRKVKIPSLKRFLKRKVRVVRIGWRKIVKRLKESQSHFGDLFAGNYLFLQVTPTPYTTGANMKPAGYCISHDPRHRLSSASSLYSVPKMI